MVLDKANQGASLEGFVAECGPEARVAPIMATPAIFTQATGKAAAIVGAAAVGYVTTKVK
ncbi:hypothetical protein [Streptomyces halobius]|uniref:Uncharacterized protein n=1 Tax=Streptomyces halobius TaxID=2879846 RepID=A0ABY4MKA9_9ACTN|nr:hypothetical protein [Streptomyces halobius]UQA97513.1 hypothetical protein K9S39_41720 [Streptomyces halobius]